MNLQNNYNRTEISSAKFNSFVQRYIKKRGGLRTVKMMTFIFRNRIEMMRDNFLYRQVVVFVRSGIEPNPLLPHKINIIS